MSESPKLVKLVGLRGDINSGKSTTARILEEEHGYTEVSFAEPLKQICMIAFRFTEAQVTDQKLKETIDPRWGITPRQAMQVVGTELFRIALVQALPQIKVGSAGIWVRNAEMRIEEELLPQGKDHIVISDNRFPNECCFLHDKGGVIAKIERPSVQRHASKHMSEMALDQIPADYVIMNDSTLDVLRDRVRVFANSISHRTT